MLKIIFQHKNSNCNHNLCQESFLSQNTKNWLIKTTIHRFKTVHFLLSCFAQLLTFLTGNSNACILHGKVKSMNRFEICCVTFVTENQNIELQIWKVGMTVHKVYSTTDVIQPVFFSFPDQRHLWSISTFLSLYSFTCHPQTFFCYIPSSVGIFVCGIWT